MIAALKNIYKAFQKPKVCIELTVDHVELAETYLILGLNLAWLNETPDALPVREVQVRLFHQGTHKEPVRFYSQGHFAHVPGQKLINKYVGSKSFVLPAHNSHIESLRFFTRAVLDLPEGKYPVEIHSTVPAGEYVHDTEIEITKRVKYRTSEAWSEEVPHI